MTDDRLFAFVGRPMPKTKVFLAVEKRISAEMHEETIVPNGWIPKSELGNLVRGKKIDFHLHQPNSDNRQSINSEEIFASNIGMRSVSSWETPAKVNFNPDDAESFTPMPMQLCTPLFSGRKRCRSWSETRSESDDMVETPCVESKHRLHKVLRKDEEEDDESSSVSYSVQAVEQMMDGLTLEKTVSHDWFLAEEFIIGFK